MKSPKLVAEINYTCAGNYHKTFIVAIPEGKTFKIAKNPDDPSDADFTDITKFGISEEEWQEKYLGQFEGGYDEELDHNQVIIIEIRVPNSDDLAKLVQ